MRSRVAFAPEPEPGSLKRSESFVIQVARHHLMRTIEEYAPPGSSNLALATTTIAGLFCDLVAGLSTAPAIIEVCNKQLRQAGLEVVPIARS